MNKIQITAKKALKYFKTKKRKNGSMFWCLKNNTPENIQNLCYKAHNGTLPDDYKFSFIVNALTIISESENLDDAQERLEPSIYTKELTEWLNSDIRRVYYIDEFHNAFGMSKDTIASLAGGQYLEMREVFDLVVGQLVESEG